MGFWLRQKDHTMYCQIAVKCGEETSIPYRRV
jgi:hypothetical protein